MSKKNIHNSKIEIIYFYMDGCFYCNEFEPVWKELNNKINNIIQIKKFEKNEKNDKIKKIIKEYGDEINSYPTILLKINNIYYKYDSDRTVNDIIKFILDKIDKENNIYVKLNDIVKEFGNNNNSDNDIKLIYFYMDMCGWCEQFNPIWTEFCKKINGNIYTIKFNANEMNNNEMANMIIKEYGQDIVGFPTILLKINNKYHNFDKERTEVSLAKFIMENIDKNSELYQYMDKEFNKNQKGGGKNVNYRNKYKKYKKMYAELAIKYNNLKK